MIPTNAEEALYLFDLWKAKHSGRFAEAYAAAEAKDDPAERALCEQVGAEIGKALAKPAGSEARVRALIHALTQLPNDGDEEAFLTRLIESMDHLAVLQERKARIGRSAEDRQCAAFGTFVCWAAAMQHAGLYVEREILARMTVNFCHDDALSITDVLGVVGALTKFVPLQAWVDAATQDPQVQKLGAMFAEGERAVPLH